MTASSASDYSLREKQGSPGCRRLSSTVSTSGSGRAWFIVVIPMMLSVLSNPDLRAQGLGAEDGVFADAHELMHAGEPADHCEFADGDVAAER